MYCVYLFFRMALSSPLNPFTTSSRAKEEVEEVDTSKNFNYNTLTHTLLHCNADNHDTYCSIVTGDPWLNILFLC